MTMIARRKKKIDCSSKELVGQAVTVIKTIYIEQQQRGQNIKIKAGSCKQNQTVYTWQSTKHTPKYLHHC